MSRLSKVLTVGGLRVEYETDGGMLKIHTTRGSEVSIVEPEDLEALAELVNDARLDHDADKLQGAS